MINPPGAAPPQTGHYCPVCLRRVRAGQAQRRAHRETCRSGDLEISLLLCPTCGLALAAEALEGQGHAGAALHALHG